MRESDAEALTEELQRHGFSVTKLTGHRTDHSSVLKALSEFISKSNSLNKNDIVLFSFSGHGTQLDVSSNGRKVETPFLCLSDTIVGESDTMISLNWLLDQFKAQSGCNNNLFLIDACRNNSTARSKTIDGNTIRELPSKLSILFSSSSGQVSCESDKYGHGIFTYCVLNGFAWKGQKRARQN